MVTCAKVLANWVGYIIVMSVSEPHNSELCGVVSLCTGFHTGYFGRGGGVKSKDHTHFYRITNPWEARLQEIPAGR